MGECLARELSTLHDQMRGVLLVLIGAGLAVMAFPPFGPGWLIVPGVALFLAALRLAEVRRKGLILGALYGVAFFGGLMWWISELGLVAVIPLVGVLSAFPAWYGWWLSGYAGVDGRRWFLLAVGGWAVMEMVRYVFPVGGLEWGAAGYALSDQGWGRSAAILVGASGWTVIVALVAAGLVVAALDRRWVPMLATGAVVVVVILVGAMWADGRDHDSDPLRVVIVQGSTPCPFEHCPPNERFGTYLQHLELTRTLEPGQADLVVWSEGSTGSTNADPAQNPEVGEAIGSEARRIGAWMLVGGDRPVSPTHWRNANVVFDPAGNIVGEYRKQHPVPFGEHIPFRPLFDWIPALYRVPRDMIPGDGPVVFDIGGIQLGSVISFEGAFARYARQHVGLGADLIVVATNEGSYGLTPAADQLIGITRMRAAELGMGVVHAAVTGKSVVIDQRGELVSDVSGLGTQEIIAGEIGPGTPTPYSVTGDVLLYAAALNGAVWWWRTRLQVAPPRQPSEA